jgi:hypothetical protein
LIGDGLDLDFAVGLRRARLEAEPVRLDLGTLIACASAAGLVLSRIAFPNALGVARAPLSALVTASGAAPSFATDSLNAAEEVMAASVASDLVDAALGAAELALALDEAVSARLDLLLLLVGLDLALVESSVQTPAVSARQQLQKPKARVALTRRICAGHIRINFGAVGCSLRFRSIFGGFGFRGASFNQTSGSE